MLRTLVSARAAARCGASGNPQDLSPRQRGQLIRRDAENGVRRARCCPEHAERKQTLVDEDGEGLRVPAGRNTPDGEYRLISNELRISLLDRLTQGRRDRVLVHVIHAALPFLSHAEPFRALRAACKFLPVASLFPLKCAC